jgi:hypothetical protein
VNPSPQIALVGPFDQPSLTWQLNRRVVEMELADRGLDATVRVFAPGDGAVLAAGIDPVERLGPPDTGRIVAFRDRFTRVIVLGDPGAAAQWCGPPQQVVPVELDPAELARLARRWCDTDALARHREFLVGMQWWPRTGPVTVVQGDVTIPTSQHSIVVIEAEPGDARDGEPRISLSDGACADDLVAAIALADDVRASAPAVQALAASFRDGTPDPTVSLDAGLDALFRDLTGAEPQRLVAGHVDALRQALDARGRRLAWERTAMADRVWEIERRLEGELAERDARIAALEAERDALRARIEVRVRAALGKVRRRFSP